MLEALIALAISLGVFALLCFVMALTMLATGTAETSSFWLAPMALIALAVGLLAWRNLDV